MQKLQTELKIQWKFASQATPSPKAKATMEALDRTRNDLTHHYDSVVHSLKQLNARSGVGGDRNANTHRNGNRFVDNGNNGDRDGSQQPEGKPVDEKVQIDNANIDKSKKGMRICDSFTNICICLFYCISFSLVYWVMRYAYLSPWLIVSSNQLYIIM